ncbi:MAG: DUF1295 domain-containing protein [Marmoricola sp.]
MTETGPVGVGLAPLGGACAVAVALLFIALALYARRTGRLATVDSWWGPAFVVVAVVALVLGGGDLPRRVVLAVLATAWGIRLGWHIHRRNAGREDPRYRRLLERTPGGFVRVALTRVFVPQAVLVWVISTPLQVSAASGPGVRWVLVLGVVVWAVGYGFEAVGDAQLARFKADPDNHGRLMDRGLWSWTRHPNYFGDACVWWGLYLVAASAWPGVCTVASPAIMTALLVWGSGVRMTERAMAGRPGWTAYAARTSVFLPRPPRRRSA